MPLNKEAKPNLQLCPNNKQQSLKLYINRTINVRKPYLKPFRMISIRNTKPLTECKQMISVK